MGNGRVINFRDGDIDMAAAYIESNYTALFEHVPLYFNSTEELQMEVVNGTGRLSQGYISANCRVEGMDLLLQLQLATFVFVVILTFIVSFYVAIYTWRMMTND